MKFKKEYLILVLIIIVLSVYLYRYNADRELYELPDIAPISGKDATKLEIKKGESDIVLTKKDEKWYIAPNEYPTDAGKTKKMLDGIKDLELTALVSESKNYNRYNLEDDQKINVKVYQANDLKLDIDIGKTASSFRHTFVKLSGDHRVYHAQGNLENAFDVSSDSLRDKVVLTLKPAEIQQFNITKGSQTLAFARTEVPVDVKAAENKDSQGASQPPPKMVWQVASGEAVNESALNQLLNAVSNLQCEKFIDDRKKEDLTGPEFTLELKGVQDHTLSIFPKAGESDTTYPAISSGSDYPFQLSASQVDGIMKEPSALLQKPPADGKDKESPKTDPN